MPALTCYFAFAGLLPFTILLVRIARATARRLREPDQLGLAGAAAAVLGLMALAAIDTGFATLALRAALLALHPPGSP